MQQPKGYFLPVSWYRFSDTCDHWRRCELETFFAKPNPTRTEYCYLRDQLIHDVNRFGCSWCVLYLAEAGTYKERILAIAQSCGKVSRELIAHGNARLRLYCMLRKNGVCKDLCKVIVDIFTEEFFEANYERVHFPCASLKAK